MKRYIETHTWSHLPCCAHFALLALEPPISWHKQRPYLDPGSLPADVPIRESINPMPKHVYPTLSILSEEDNLVLCGTVADGI